MGARIEDAESLVFEERTARTTADEALAESINALSAQIGDDIQAQIYQEAQTRANADAVTAQTIALLGAKNAGNTAFILDQNKVMVTRLNRWVHA
ncbi:tail fiber protein [Xanthomonas phage JGB6]|nr:tail fiber protein [Xanthomonas phage JGB6]